MPLHGDSYVRMDGGVIVWDGINKPDNKNGEIKYNLAVVFPPTSPDIPLLDQLSRDKLNASKFQGQLPQGGHWPINAVKPGDLKGHFDGWLQVRFKSGFIPDVYDDQAHPAPIDPMQFKQVIYPGQKVAVLANCYVFDSHGNQGVGAGLGAISIQLAERAQRLDLGGIDAAAAFGSGGVNMSKGQPMQQASPQNVPQGYQHPPQQEQPAQPAYQHPPQQEQPAQPGADFLGPGGY